MKIRGAVMIPLLALLQERSGELPWVWGTTVAAGCVRVSVRIKFK